MTNGVWNSVLDSGSFFGKVSAADKLTSSKRVLSAEDDDRDFSTILQDAIKDSLTDTQNLIDKAEQAELEFAMGRADNTEDLMIAQSKASMAVNYVVAVRDRFLDAYKEIMNMQI